MPERPGGFERREIDNGFRALASARSPEDINRLIDSMAVLRSPIFHAYLRQYRLNNMAEFQKVPEAYRSFMLVYDTLFTRLHFLANAEQSRSETNADAPEPDADVEPDTDPVATGANISGTLSYFAALRRALGAAVPPADGHTFNPATDAERIAAAVEQLTDRRVQLPDWKPVPGTLWSAVIVACGKCRAPRLIIRPYFLDIFGDPKLLDSLRARAFEWSRCPRCAGRMVFPLSIWICDQPAPHDPLAAICILCRVRETEIIFRPPPGTERRPEDDRILEVRLDMMIRQLGIEQNRAAKTVVLTNSIAYSLEELLWRIDWTAAAPGRVAYEDLRADVYQKLLSGLLNWEDTERWVRQHSAEFAAEWPIEPAHAVGDLMKALVMNLVAEAAAEAQGRPSGLRIALAGLVSQCYLGLGELARARIWLARARDMAGDADSTTLEALDANEVDLLRAEGRYEEAALIRARHPQSPSAGEDSTARLTRARLLQNEGIDLRVGGQLADAIGTLREGLTILRALAAETDPPSPDVRHTLSGTLANLADVYVDCAQNTEVLSALAVRPLNAAGLHPRVRRRLQRLGSPEALQAMQKQMEGPVNALLDAEFAGAMTAAALRARAAELFREAIAQSLDYEYLCIQSRGLARVLLDSDDLDGAAEAARACLSYAARIRSYGYMADAWWVLAEVARERDDAPGALTALAGCLQAEMRQVVRAGSAPHDNVKALSVKALRLASRGADPLTAILIVESGKAIATSVSLIRAVPLQGRRPGPLQELYEERETLRLRSIWEAGGELNAQMAGAEAVIVRARRDLAVRDPRAATWHDATYLDISRPVPVRRLLAELGPRTTYLGFVVDRSRLFAYAVWPEDQILESVEFPSDGIASHDSAKLGSTLLQPLAARLRALAADDRLIISPSPELDAVPFGLLPFDGRPLCIHATISIVNGSGMLEACASRPALALHTAVAVGAPARPDTVELPHAVREVEQIARKMETAGIQVQPLLLGAAATVPALVDRAATADLIHLACHAFAANDEQAARLLLAPAPLANDSGVLSDDRIVSEIDLKAGCHVNLAACRTSIAGGEGAYFANGLVAAFLVGGASSVLATLWPLSDAPAATFQAAYYDHLIAGLSPAFALAATQRAAIRGDLGDELRRPENFGGYVLHGVAATSRNTRTPT